VTEIADLKIEIAANVYTEIADLKTEISAKFSFLTDAIIWSNMTLESLRTTAIAKGVSDVDTMTKVCHAI
jgi:hypothetical protein